jgi:hypothetical protein
LRNQLVVCARSAGWAPQAVLRPRQVPHGAVVVVLSPFEDDGAVEVAVHAARRGHLVLAVDVLPTPLRPDPETPWGEAAMRIINAEHLARLDAMGRHGIAVVPADGAIGAVLRKAARPGRRLAR